MPRGTADFFCAKEAEMRASQAKNEAGESASSTSDGRTVEANAGEKSLKECNERPFGSLKIC